MSSINLARLWNEGHFPANDHPVMKRWNQGLNKNRGNPLTQYYLARLCMSLFFIGMLVLGYWTYRIQWLRSWPNPHLQAFVLISTMISVFLWIVHAKSAREFAQLLERSCDVLGMHVPTFCKASPEVLISYGRVALRTRAVDVMRSEVIDGPMSAKHEAARAELRKAYDLLVHNIGILPDDGYDEYFQLK